MSDVVRVRSTGQSMWPVIRSGDELVVDRAARDVRAGEVWITEHGGAWIAHRVGAIDGVRVRCRNVWGGWDPWVDRTALVGRVLGVVREGRVVELPRHRLRWLWMRWFLVRGLLERLRRRFDA